MAEDNLAAQRQTPVTAYLKSRPKQLLLFAFARQAYLLLALQSQTTVTAYIQS